MYPAKTETPSGMSPEPPQWSAAGGGGAQQVSGRRISLRRYQAGLATAAGGTSPSPAVGRRCGASHASDARPCEGRHDAVRVIDRTGMSVDGCVLHSAALLASLEGGWVVPLNGPDGAAIDAFRRAQAMSPFDFLSDRGIAVTATTAVDAIDSPSPGIDSAAPSGAYSSWSETGNARSSCSNEIMESRSREIA